MVRSRSRERERERGDRREERKGGGAAPKGQPASSQPEMDQHGLRLAALKQEEAAKKPPEKEGVNLGLSGALTEVGH